MQPFLFKGGKSMLYDPRGGACARQVCWLPVGSITPRAEAAFAGDGDASLEEMAASIRREGLHRPITVEDAGGGRYRILSGNRRFLACRMAGLTHVDAVILASPAAGMDARGLMEALLSGQMHYLEEAAALDQLLTVHGMRREALATALGKTTAAVAQKTRLNALDSELKALLLEENLPECTARALLKLPDKQGRLVIARKAAAQHLCVRDVELMVKSAASRLPVPPVPGGRTISIMRDYRLYLNAIRAIVAQMQEAGLAAQEKTREMGDTVEVTIRIPTRRKRSRQQLHGDVVMPILEAAAHLPETEG